MQAATLLVPALLQPSLTDQTKYSRIQLSQVTSFQRKATNSHYRLQQEVCFSQYWTGQNHTIF